ncbi:hypothetical protein KJ708_04115 [bacterium]|nr:hypothetical protein [bacterium]MBU1917543.1 hypothetical protein [bacterium]
MKKILLVTFFISLFIVGFYANAAKNPRIINPALEQMKSATNRLVHVKNMNINNGNSGGNTSSIVTPCEDLSDSQAAAQCEDIAEGPSYGASGCNCSGSTAGEGERDDMGLCHYSLSCTCECDQ